MSTKNQGDAKSDHAPTSPSVVAPKPKRPADEQAAEQVEGPKSKEAMHATESKAPHPQGKTRHGGRNG